MDSPVIVDNASKFGRGIDLAKEFAGFPFDDDGFGSRRNDIRSHLDDLAARHPEFADRLLGSAWGDAPFHGSLRNRRRGSGSSRQQFDPDEDTRSQASGSSAASGGSGISSNSENDSQRQNTEQNSRQGSIPHHGLRNTVDIGQHQHNMENPDRNNRNQRSMSAPPENRQQWSGQEPNQQPQGQRFVSRVDITPQHNSQAGSQQQSQPQQPQQQQSQPSNVRHIPIFVEGRDEPVIRRSPHEEPHHQRQPSPHDFHTPQESIFNQYFGGRQRQWPPHFDEPFYEHSEFETPVNRRSHAQNYQQPRSNAERQRQDNFYRPHQSQQQHPYYTQQQYHPQQTHHQHHDPQEPHRQQPPPHQQQHEETEQHEQHEEQTPIKRKQVQPKDPLEKVALVQEEVDSLAEQVKAFTGTSRKDKQYIYLDEMLTRELIKLDDIETEGKDNVRQARKNAIKCIQETISLLESKIPVEKKEESEHLPEDVNQDVAKEDGTQSNCSAEIKDMGEKIDQTESNAAIITSPNSSDLSQEKSKELTHMETTLEDVEKEALIDAKEPNQQTSEAVVSQTIANTTNKDSNTNITTQESEQISNPVTETNQPSNEQEMKIEITGDENQSTVAEEDPVEQKPTSDSQAVPPKKSPKKTKKKAPVAPISEQAIPLPPPQNVESTNK